MHEYTLTNQDLQDINILIDLGESIIKNEQKLIDLEIKGLKETDEYKNAIEALKSTLFLESNIFNNIGTDPSKITAIISYLINDVESVLQLDKKIAILINGKKRELILHRITTRLNNIMIENNKSMIEKQSSVLCVDKKSNEIINFSAYGLINMNLEIRKDIIYTIMAILNQEIHNKNNSKSITDFLIKVKYYLSFLYKFIEDDLINNNFEANSQVYWTSKNMVTFYKLDEKIYHDSIINYNEVVVLPSLNFIENLSDTEFANLSNANIIKLHSIILRAGLTFTPENIKNKLKEEIIKNTMLKKIFNSGNYISNEFAVELFEKSSEDLKSISIITLNLKRES